MNTNTIETKQQQKQRQLQETATSRGHHVLGQYNNAITPVAMQCANGHRFSICPQAYKSRSGCPQCTPRSTEPVLSRFHSALQGSNMLSDSLPTRIKSTVDVTCPEGHKRTLGVRSFLLQPECIQCKKDELKSAFMARLAVSDLTMITPYVEITTKSQFVCSAGHITEKPPNNYTAATIECAMCRKHSTARCRKDFESWLQSSGTTALSVFIKGKEPIVLQCPNGHVYTTTPSKAAHINHNCDACHKQKAQVRRQQFEREMSDRGYTVVQYLGGSYSLIKCDRGHVTRKNRNVPTSQLCCVVCRANDRLPPTRQFTIANIGKRLRVPMRTVANIIEQDNLGAYVDAWGFLVDNSPTNMVNDHIIPIAWSKGSIKAGVMLYCGENHQYLTVTENCVKHDRLTKDALLRIVNDDYLMGIIEYLPSIPENTRYLIAIVRSLGVECRSDFVQKMNWEYF